MSLNNIKLLDAGLKIWISRVQFPLGPLAGFVSDRVLGSTPRLHVYIANWSASHQLGFLTCSVCCSFGFLRRIKYYLPYNALLLFYNSFVLPIFDYAHLVWGDKDNVSLIKESQILQKKAAKLIVDRPLHSSSTDVLKMS